MVKLKINPKYRDLIPPISKEEYDLLEKSILKEGCRDALVTWEDTILDGHNRYEICSKHDIKFKQIDKSFENEAEAKLWIVCNQLARRNLAPEQMSNLRGMRYNLEKQQVGGQMPKGVDQNEPPLSTAEKIAKETGVSPATIRRDAEFAEALDKLPPEEKKEVLAGKSKKSKKEIIESKKAKKKTPKAKPLAVDLVNEEIKTTFEAFYEAVRKARKNHWKDTPKKAIKNLLENLEGLLIQ